MCACKMPESWRLKRVSDQRAGHDFVNCWSSSFYKYNGTEPCEEFSYSHCPGGLFVDPQFASSHLLTTNSDKIGVPYVPFASLSMFLTLLGAQHEPSLNTNRKSCTPTNHQLSLAKGLFSCALSSWGDCMQMFFASGKQLLSDSRTTENGSQGYRKRERNRNHKGDHQFLSISLSMKDSGDILKSSGSFISDKSLDDSVFVKDAKESIRKIDSEAEELSDRSEQTALEDAGVKFGGESALNTSKHLWAGAVAAMVSRTFVAPLERLKLEYIVRGEQKHIIELIQSITASQGLKGFWKGNVVNLLRTAPFKSINFYAYDTYRKKLLLMTGNEDATNFERFVAGAAAGITATILCLPMDTIRTKMVAPGGEALGGVIGVCRHMVQTQGFFSLYKGLLPAIISMAPSGAVFYGVYDILKTGFLHSPEGKERLRLMRTEGKGEPNALEQLELGPMRTLLYGAISGACAEAATYPFEVVRRHLQMQGPETRLNALATCAKIVEQGGVGALYAGLIPSMLQVLPSAALSYFVYEFMKIVLRVE